MSAAGDPAGCTVTIAKVELKDRSGRWIRVAEPDHPVDMVRDQPGFSFFNDGRVPAGDYINFRISLLDTVKVRAADGSVFRQKLSRPGRGPEITASKDLAEALRVRRGSFIAASFELDLRGTVDVTGSVYVFDPPRTVEWAEITVDEDTRRLASKEVLIGYA